MQSLMAQDDCSKMAEESCLLKEDGYLNADTDVKQIVYHPTLNVILICSSSGTVHVLDVNSGFVLQSTGLSAENQSEITCRYIGGLDRVLFCDGQSLGARSDYNGVLLLDTILQKTVTCGRDDVKIELLLSEAIILKQCLLNYTSSAVDYILNELTQKIQEAQKQCKKGIKAQKWNTVCLELPLEFLTTGTNIVMSEMLMKNQHSPEVSVTSAVQERALELLGEPGKASDKSTMASEVKRRETFAHWPHMDYKWALPDQMAQAGFYHQPNTIGDDRAMCFTCSVCLVCWEKTDEPWSEHERHSPTCPFVVGEYTQNVPLSVTYATNPAIDATFRGDNVNILGTSSVPELIATSNTDGLISVFDVSGRLKRTHSFFVTQYDSHLLEKFTEDFGVPNVSTNTKETKTSTDKTITALSLVGDKQNKSTNIRPSIICGLKIKCSDSNVSTSLNIMEIDDAITTPKSTCLYIVVYDFQFTKDLENVTIKEEEVNETEETNNDKVMALFEPPDLSFISKIKTFENQENMYQNLIPGDSDQIYMPPLQPKPWVSYEPHTGPRKLPAELQKSDTDSAQATSFSVSNILYPSSLNVDKFKKSISDHIMEMNNPKDTKKLNYSRAVQCVSIPNKYKNREDLSISDIIPSQDGCFILIVLKSISNHKNSVMLLYSLDFNHKMVKIIEEPVYCRELSPEEKPMEVGTISLFDKNNDCCNKIGPDGLVILVGCDGAVRVIDLATLKITAIAKLETEKFVSAVYCNSLERLCASTEKGSLHFFALNDTDTDSTEDHDDEDLLNSNTDLPNPNQPMVECMDGVESAHYFQEPEIIAFSELKRLKQLCDFEPLKSGFNPVVPPCWSEMQQAQRQRRHPQHMQKDRELLMKTWRLQTDTTTFDEHIFEVTLPTPTYIEHVEFSFTLHNARGVPRVEVTLLRQNTTSIGHKRDVSFAVDDCVSFDQLESSQNPVTSQEYLRQHNAEILAGPVDIASCLDLTDQTGCVMLTSPKLFKSRNRNLLLHLKSVGNKDDTRSNRFTQSSVSEYVGCDCLHEVTITVYNSTHTEIPHEKSLRCSMLESGVFIESLFKTVLESKSIEMQGTALDILGWVATVRLAKTKCSNENNQQVEFLLYVSNYLEDLLEKCLLQANRSISHKCVKLLVVCSEAVNVGAPMDNFNTSILTALLELMNKIYEIKSSGALHWLLILLYKVSKNSDLTKKLASKCIELLTDISKQLNKRSNPYHLILRSRYGLYGSPLEPELFDIEPPSPIKGSSTSITYASIVSGECLNPSTDIFSSFVNKDYLDPKDVLLNSTETKVKLKNIMPAMMFRGLLETEPLHYTCVSASDGTRVERVDAKPVPITITQALTSGTKKIEVMDIFNDFDFVISYNKAKKDFVNVPSTSHATLYSSDDNPQVFFNTDNLHNEDFAKLLMENIKQKKNNFYEIEEVAKPVRHFNESFVPYKAFSWQQLLVTPAQQVIVVDRMHSGARRFVTFDFGQPILLTDIFLPTCGELLSVTIDIWLKGEDVDTQRLVLSTDIGTKNLIFCDLQPPPLCRYLKITAVGRYGMSSTRCRIPIGCFYGHLVVLPDEIPNEHLPNMTPVTDEDLKKQLSALEVLFEDVSCRYSLSCSKLKNLLQPFLMSDPTNAAHLAAFMDIMRDKNVSLSFDDMKIFNAYQEAITFQHQLNIIRNVMNRIEVGLKIDKQQNSESNSLAETCSDKLRSIAEVLLEILLKLDCNPQINMETCQSLFQGFCVTQKSHVQFLAATVLDHSCRKKPFWGVFLANTLAEMFSSTYNTRFPQDRVFVLLSYLVKRCSERSVAFDETMKMIAMTIQPLQQENRALLGVTVDLSLLGWLLLFLSLQMDLSKGTSRASNRWSWVVGELSNKGLETISSSYKKKLQKRFLLSKQQQYENDSNKAVKKNSTPAQTLTEKLQQALKGSEGIFSKLKQVRIKATEGLEPKQFGKRRREASMETGGEKSAQISDPKFIDPTHSLAVVTKLIDLLLSVDHSCSADLFVLSCKVIARLAKLSKLPLSLCMDMKSLLKLINLCIGSELPFISHALVCLLQDILEIGNVQIPCSESDIQTSSTGWRSDIFRDVEDLCKSFEIEDAFLTEPVVKQGKTTTTNNNHLSSVYESEDSEIEDFFDELIETSSPVPKKNSKLVSALYGSSCAIDQRLESSIEAQTEITLRRLIQHNANLLVQAINSPVNVVEIERPSSNWPVELLPVTVLPRTFNHNIKMVAACFDELFKNLEMQPVFKIEQILQLWLTLNCQFTHDKFNPSTMPSISLTTKAINSLITAISWCTNLSLRAWCLTLQTLTLVCNVTIGSLEGEDADDEDTETTRMFGKTSVIVNHRDFVQMFLRLLSGTGVQFSEQGLVGPAVCSAMHDFLVRLQMRCDVTSPSSVTGGKLKSYLLKVVYQLVQLSGPLSSKLGPLDAQCKFFQSLVCLVYNNADLSIAMSIFESAGVLVLSHVSNNERVKCVNIGEKPGSSVNSFNGIFASVLGTESNKQDKPISRDVLLMYLLKLVENLVQTPLPSGANNIEQEYMETDPEPVSQTDESKAEQIHPIPTRANPQVPCLADTALQHHPSIIRLYKALATCKSTSLSMIPYSYLSMQSFEDLRESGSIGDAVFNVLGSLSRKASQKTLLMEPLLMFLIEVPQLSEPLIWFIIQVLDSVESLKIFLEADGIQVICKGLVQSSVAPNTINAYGSLAMVMQHFIGQNSKTEANVIGVPSNNKKQMQVSMENNLNLINFAPQGTIRCLTSTTAHSPDILIQGGQATHRRARAPQWSYHFYPEEAHADLQIQLPSAFLLREVQIQPHQGTLVTCPSAVSLEVSSAGPAHLVPACSPLTTSGMSFIRLHLNSPEVVNCVQIRLYKPRDASNIGLSQIRLLGSTAFGGIAKPQVSDLLEDESHCKFSLSWLRLLYHCCTISAKTDLEKIVILKAAEIEELLPTCCGLLLRPTHIPSLYLGNLEKVLCELSLISKENSLKTIRMLLENKPNIIEHSTMFNFGNDKMLINSPGSQSPCDLLYRICTYQDENTAHRLNVLLTWLVDQQDQATLMTSSCNSVYISITASILWDAKQSQVTYDLKSLITREFFDCVYNLSQICTESASLKHAINSILCSICYVRTEYYYGLLAKMDILTPDESTDFIDESESMTDDSKCSFVYNSEENIRYVIKSSDNINITLEKLETIALVSRSPTGVQLLLDSTLPKLLIQVILNFCEDVSGNFPISLLETITAILNFFSEVSEEKLMRDWLGSMYGSKFWLPLLKYLCQRNTERKSSLRSEALTRLEETCVKFLTKCCLCHTNNQNLLARVLCEVIILQSNGISGFLRRLILQLLLENEKIPVSIKADETLYKNSTILYPYLPQHPAFKQTHDRALLYLPTNITIGDILEQYLSFSSCLKNEQTNTRKEFRSRIKSFCVALDSDLSVAAGVTAKDKRIKDVKNLISSTSAPVLKKKRNATRDCSETPEGRMVKCPALSEQSLPLEVTVAQVLKMIEEKGVHCDLTCLHLTISQTKGAEDEMNKLKLNLLNQEPLSSTLQVFSSMGGLALLARHLPALPNVIPETIRVPVVEKSSNDLSESDWIKVDGSDDIYEDIEDCPSSSTPTKVPNPTPNVPSHSLTAFSLFLRLPGYAEVLLRDMKKALCLLRLVLGVTDDGEGSDIFQSPVADLLPTLPFEVLKKLYDSTPLSTDDGTLLRRLSITTGVVHLILGYLGIFSHQTQSNQQKDSKARDDKGQLYWAKGTGFGTGSTQQSWNVEQALMKQRSEEEHVTVLLQVLSSYINPSGKSEEELQLQVLPPIFEELLSESSLLPALSSYLRNDSVLDMARHIPLYRAALELLRAMAYSSQLVKLLLPQDDNQGPSISSLLKNMKTCVDTYASKLRSAQSQKTCKKTNSKSTGTKYKYKAGEQLEVLERDEGLAMLMPDIRLTAILVCSTTDKLVGTEMSGSRDSSIDNSLVVSVEERYLNIMKHLQFDTFEMIQELSEGGYKFVISYHYENNARAAGEASHPARVKRLAQEAVTLATSLPLSHSSSVFVRCDTDRLDIMKVLITGPAETPYANGCFEFDVFFPPEYPVQPMMINLETTGHHTVRFNPNLYNDGKVCLSVLNTWHGRPEEKWNAQTSSFLQVLVSIQSLILVSEPYFNEPGYERSRGTPAGTQNSREYNANICQATVRWAMLEQLINPCPCFKDVINTHFYIKRNEIIEQCEKWLKDLEYDNAEKQRTTRTVSKRNSISTLDSYKKVFDTLKSALLKLKPPEGFEDDKNSMEVDAKPEKVVEELDVEKMVSDMCD